MLPPHDAMPDSTDAGGRAPARRAPAICIRPYPSAENTGTCRADTRNVPPPHDATAARTQSGVPNAGDLTAGDLRFSAHHDAPLHDRKTGRAEKRHLFACDGSAPPQAQPSDVRHVVRRCAGFPVIKREGRAKIFNAESFPTCPEKACQPFRTPSLTRLLRALEVFLRLPDRKQYV